MQGNPHSFSGWRQRRVFGDKKRQGIVRYWISRNQINLDWLKPHYFYAQTQAHMYLRIFSQTTQSYLGRTHTSLRYCSLLDPPEGKPISFSVLKEYFLQLPQLEYLPGPLNQGTAFPLPDYARIPIHMLQLVCSDQPVETDLLKFSFIKRQNFPVQRSIKTWDSICITGQ